MAHSGLDSFFGGAAETSLHISCRIGGWGEFSSKYAIFALNGESAWLLRAGNFSDFVIEEIVQGRADFSSMVNFGLSELGLTDGEGAAPAVAPADAPMPEMCVMEPQSETAFESGAPPADVNIALPATSSPLILDARYEVGADQTARAATLPIEVMQVAGGPYVVEIDDSAGGTIRAGMFGGNYFFANGNARIADETFAWAQSATGVSSWRYPGGSISEQAFDMSDARHFEEDPENFIDAPSGDTVVPLSKFLKLASQNGTAISIVLPTVDGLVGAAVKTERGEDIDARNVSNAYLELLEDFIKNAIEIANYWGVEIEAFEIGNEFWGSGQMNQIEYGRLAGKAAVVISEAMADARYDADILVQTVHSRNEYNDNKYGHAQQPGQIAQGIKDAGAADLIDGIVNHIYADDFSLDEGDKATAFASYQKMEDALYSGSGARSDGADQLSYSLTEWNLQAKNSDTYGYGLKQATVISEMFYTAAVSGISSANIWKVMGSSVKSTALLFTPEATSTADAKLKHTGALFKMMNESVRTHKPGGNGDIIDEGDGHDVEFYNYLGDGSNVIFITNQTPYEQQVDLDLSALIADFDDSYFLTATILGDDADAFASSDDLAKADVIWKYLAPRDMEWDDGLATVTLQDWEILRIEFTAVTPSADVLIGRDGDDYIVGRGGQDTLKGGGGKDILVGGSGADRLVGGEGRDRAQYKNAQNAVYVDLAKPENNTGQAEGDTFKSIEDLYGSIYDDTLLGNKRSNKLWGHDGDDKLYGRKGNDVLFGMEGDDTFVFAKNWDEDLIKDFEPGRDRLMIKGYSDTLVLDDLQALARIEEGNLVIDFGDGDIVTLQDMTLDQVIDDILIV